MYHRHLFVLSVACFVVACPGEESRVEHVATVGARPDVACIWDRLLDIAKWPRVQTIRDETPVGVHHRFIFETNGALHAIGILIGNDGSFTFRNTASSPNFTLPELRAAQQSLFDVEEALDGQCNLGDLVDSVQQACYGKNCDRLADENN
jgi:hypothetical protein